MDKADRGTCEVWIQAAVPGEAGGLASMIAPLIDQDADALEAALLEGPVQAGRDLSAGEASQLAEILEGFGARAEVRMGFGAGPALPAMAPPPGAHLRSTQPFDAGALRATLEARGIDLGGVLRGKPEVPRDMAETPPVAALAPEPEILIPLAGPVPELAMQAPIIDKALLPPLPRPPQRQAARSAPPPPVEQPVVARRRRRRPPAPRRHRRAGPPPPAPRSCCHGQPPADVRRRAPHPGPLMTDEPTQVNPMDEELLQAALAAAEAAEVAVAVPPPLAPTPPPRTPTAPPAPTAPPPVTGPARPAATTGEEPALRGKVGLPRSLQSSRDDLPPWFPRVPMRPEAAPKRSRLPLVLFGIGVAVALGTLAFFLLR
ncbi:MAG: hypothetical protein H6706_06230 [Myxococcales bacterium]|nr:hypothetical protein [Myxococcales bacterium]